MIWIPIRGHPIGRMVTIHMIGQINLFSWGSIARTHKFLTFYQNQIGEDTKAISVVFTVMRKVRVWDAN